MKNILLLAAALLFVCCGSLKKHESSRSEKSQLDSAHSVTSNSLETQTGLQSTSFNNKIQAYDFYETTIYPAKGKPFRIENGKTYTGEIDSAKSKHYRVSNQEQSSKQTLQIGKTLQKSSKDSTNLEKTNEILDSTTDTKRTGISMEIKIIAGVLLVVLIAVAYFYFRSKL
jgi:cobalamin biosynthesis Mg chelatase CobN